MIHSTRAYGLEKNISVINIVESVRYVQKVGRSIFYRGFLFRYVQKYDPFDPHHPFYEMHRFQPHYPRHAEGIVGRSSEVAGPWWVTGYD